MQIADTLIFYNGTVNFTATWRLAVHTLFGKYKGKSGQKFFASPKICTRVPGTYRRRRISDHYMAPAIWHWDVLAPF